MHDIAVLWIQKQWWACEARYGERWVVSCWCDNLRGMWGFYIASCLFYFFVYLVSQCPINNSSCRYLHCSSNFTLKSKTCTVPFTVEDYLSSELPIFLELRVRYLQACERIQEAMALSKSCLENPEAGKHLYFHQAYLTCLYKASLYENLNKEVRNWQHQQREKLVTWGLKCFSTCLCLLEKEVETLSLLLMLQFKWAFFT